MQRCRDRNRKIVLLVGKSGTGKSTLVNALGMREVISMKSRPLRAGEVEGVHAYFMQWDEITGIPQEMVVARNEFDGHMYGATVEEAWKSDVYVVDPAGIPTYIDRYREKKDIPEPSIVYLTAPLHVRFIRMIKRELHNCRGLNMVRVLPSVTARVVKRILHDRKRFANFAAHADHVLTTG